MANEFQKAFRYGIDQPTENIATTLEALGFDTQAKELRDLIEAPEDYESAAARFINPEGEWYDYNWSELPLATVEQAGQLGGSILSRIGGAGIGAGAGSLVGPGGTAIGGIMGAFLGPALFEAVQIAGPVAFERARNNGREEPNAEDWSGALGTAGFSGVLNAIGIKNIGLLNSTVGKTLKAGAREGVTEAGQGFTEQIGGTGLTAAGLQIDPKAAIGEGLVGWSSGTSIQAPIAAAQAVQTTGGTPSTTPAAAVDQMQETVYPTDAEVTADLISMQAEDTARTDAAIAELQRGATSEDTDLAAVAQMMLGDRVEQTNLTQANVDEFLNRIPDTMDISDEGFNANEAEVRQTFVEQFEDQMRAHMNNHLSERDREMAPSTRNNALLDAQNTLIANFELNDPRSAAMTTSTLRDRINSAVEEAVDARFRATAKENVIQQTSDPRFDFEYDPLRTQEDVYTKNPREFHFTNKPKLPEGSIRQGITSIETGIDPVFMSTSTLIPFLSNLPNKPMSAEQAMNIIGIKEDGNWFKPSKSDKAVTDRVREAVDSHVASFLKDKKNANQPVTREEIANVFNDHLSRFETIKTTDEEMDSSRKLWQKHPIPEPFERIEEVELWTMYDARLPEGDDIDSSVYYNTISDNMHNPHGQGTNFWVRGDIVENTDTGRTGLMLSETQSQVHSEGQDPSKSGVYLRDVSREDEADITPIRNKIDTMRKATRKLAGEIVANENRSEDSPPLTETMGLKQANYIAEVLTDSTDTNPVQETDLFITNKGYNRSIDLALREVSPKYKKEWQQVYDKYDEVRAKTLRDLHITEQPFAELYGITLKAEDFRPIKPASDTYFGSRVGAILGDIQKKLKETGNDLDADALTEPEAETVKKHTMSLYADSQDSARENYDKEQLALHKEYIPLLAQTYPTVRDVGLLAESFPTTEEITRLKEFDRTRYDTPTVPNYPFPKNWPSMTVRTGVIEAIDRDLDEVIVLSEGATNAPKTVYKQDQKAARQIAQQIADITGEDVNDLYSMVPDTEDSPGGPYFALDIRSLKELIKQKRWPGFKGYKKGGLVTKAQGAGYSMNYGDYGRSYK